MERNFLSRAAEYINEERRKRRWTKVVTAMAAVVVFCTTYALILPAITLETDVFCGQKEHSHDEGCYEQSLICTQEEAKAHTHGADCYETHRTLVCTQAESAGHSHSEACMTESSTLTCASEEEGHEHGEGCYTVTSSVTCGQAEEAGHTHGDSCWQETKTLVCTESTEIPEGGHVHGADCYGGEELTCEKEEHEHELMCYSNPRADLETASVWERTLPDELTYVWADDLLAVAESQLGYRESTENYQVDDEGRKLGYTRYGDWYGDNYGHWCAMFVSFCLHYAEIPTQDFPWEANCQRWIDELSEEKWDLYRPYDPESDENYVPVPGDLIFFNTDDDPESDHVGIVKEVKPATETQGAKVVTIEGNSTNRVEENTYDLTDDAIMGYAQLPEAEYLCGLEIHAHSSDCYDAESTLTCEVPEHAHEKGCITGDFALEEPEEPEEEPSQEEPAPEETPSEEEPEEEPVYICEQEGHLHDVDCHDSEGILICEKQEHVHTEDCMAEAPAPVEPVPDIGEPNAVAEAAIGTNWMRLRDSGWFEEYSSYANYSSSSDGEAEQQSRQLMRAAAPRMLMTAETGADDGTSAPPSDVQVNKRGGSNSSADGAVTVSKTISGTDLENVFDITLQVQTSMDVQEIGREPDMAVVIVMDISNTMNSDFGDVTRYVAAMASAEEFLDKFAASNSLGVSKVGYVAFNTHAHQIFGLSSCTTTAQADVLKNTMRTETGNIINASGYADSHTRFTNVEAGLKMGADMLAASGNKNKYIIFLSDGFPTTYVSSGYTGYNPYTSSGTPGTDGVFYDYVAGVHCDYGTSYSDKAAIRAREQATEIKNAGVKIFSIGVDVAGQKIQEYFPPEGQSFSIVDRTGTTYEIGDASSTESYKDWLKNGIGSGYYYDSTDSAGLSAAYNTIFKTIKDQVEAGTVADWVATDPMPTLNQSADTVEFIGFYTKKPTLTGNSLSGEYGVGKENTATFNDTKQTISWDLKNSGYQTTTSGTTTLYNYELVYRVRLKNENVSFVEKDVYSTNDPTSLQYRTTQTVNGKETISDPKTVNFPIPSVLGYLGELEFTKVDSSGKPLAGAEFTLSHDPACHVCRGDETPVTIDNMIETSGDDGAVSFKRIPSGHKYKLEETGVPDGYSTNGYNYQVEVAYDNVTVTVTATDGTVKEWDKRIVNNTYYELPETGGAGTNGYTFGGLLLMLGAGFLLYQKTRDGREAKSSS